MIAEHNAATDEAVVDEAARLVMTGSCDGLAELRDAIAANPELELRGWCEEVGEAAGLLARDPAAVLHATADEDVPGGALAEIRAHTHGGTDRSRHARLERTASGSHRARSRPRTG
jgi:hypothetical protein